MFDADSQAQLAAYGFDATAFASLQADLAGGRFPAERNRAKGPVTPPEAGDIAPWSAAGEAALAAARARIAEGKVAVCVLNGGMATRFGGRVKGIVEVTGGHSFLALKLMQVARARAGGAPAFVMNSFATDAPSRRHLQAHAYFGLEEASTFCQSISVRLTPAGEVFRDQKGEVSFYAPGHGDLLGALAAHPAFARFAAQKGALVAVSNVDNLGATLDARVIAAHLAGGRKITCEVARRLPGDAGSAPVRHAGRLEILEGFRFPTGFDADSLPVFNTNSFVFDAAAVRGDYPLTWFRADKQVEGRPAVQFERLLGEVTSFLPAAYVEVPREGAESRFLPVKSPGDLPPVAALVAGRLGLA